LTGFTVLARGGYATIYRATQESVGREVAVKVENRTLESDRDRRRFLREARAAGRMSSHPHVVDLFDAGVTADGHPYLIMELCDGSYAERIKTAPLPPAEARDVGVKIADALADAHALGVLHRDVKPANILLSRFGEPALADFGLAILAESRDTSITLDVLTPAYAPPEMFRHSPPSPAADVYALCATLYALMRGKPPRWPEGRPPSLVSLVDMFGERISDIPGVPVEMMNLLRAGMANDETARPSAAQLRDALTALAIGPGARPVAVPTLNPTGLPTGPVTPIPPSDDPTQPHGIYGSPPVTPPGNGGTTPSGDGGTTPPGGGTADARRRRWMALGVGVLALAVAASLLTWYARGGFASGPPRADGSPSASTTPGSAPPTSSPPSSSPPSSASPSNPVGSCLLSTMFAGAACVTTPECYGQLTFPGGVAHAASLSCQAPHTWEVFALGKLPASVTAVDYRSVKSNASVQQVCSSLTLGTLPTVGLGHAADWQIDVLPPTPEAFRAGDHTYRCLAGKGPNKLTQPQFGKPAG